MLAKCAKDCIRAFNEENTTVFFPKFPLWAFLQDSEEEKLEVKEITIQKPEFNSQNFFFPLEIQTGKKYIKVKIIFAERSQENSAEGLSFIKALQAAEEADIFPLKQKALQTAEVLLENNGWQVFDEKWIKIKEA